MGVYRGARIAVTRCNEAVESLVLRIARHEKFLRERVFTRENEVRVAHVLIFAGHDGKRNADVATGVRRREAFASCRRAWEIEPLVVPALEETRSLEKGNRRIGDVRSIRSDGLAGAEPCVA